MRIDIPPFSLAMYAGELGRIMPWIFPTLYMAPTSIAPLLPALAKDCISLCLSRRKPVEILEFGLLTRAFVGLSSISIRSGASTISKSDGSTFSSFKKVRICSLSPINTILSLAGNSLRAIIAPCKVALGAKSPPKTSKPIFISQNLVKQLNN